MRVKADADVDCARWRRTGGGEGDRSYASSSDASGSGEGVLTRLLSPSRLARAMLSLEARLFGCGLSSPDDSRPLRPSSFVLVSLSSLELPFPPAEPPLNLPLPLASPLPHRLKTALGVAAGLLAGVDIDDCGEELLDEAEANMPGRTRPPGWTCRRSGARPNAPAFIVDKCSGSRVSGERMRRSWLAGKSADGSDVVQHVFYIFKSRTEPAGAAGHPGASRTSTRGCSR